MRSPTIVRTCTTETATLSNRYQGSRRHQVSRCNGSLRVNQPMTGTSISSQTRPLDSSQTQGSQLWIGSPARRRSINSVTALPLALTTTTSSQKNMPALRCHGRKRFRVVRAGSVLIPIF